VSILRGIKDKYELHFGTLTDCGLLCSLVRAEHEEVFKDSQPPPATGQQPLFADTRSS
jgi:hypothetical protein